MYVVPCLQNHIFGKAKELSTSAATLLGVYPAACEKDATSTLCQVVNEKMPLKGKCSVFSAPSLLYCLLCSSNMQQVQVDITVVISPELWTTIQHIQGQSIHPETKKGRP